MSTSQWFCCGHCWLQRRQGTAMMYRQQPLGVGVALVLGVCVVVQHSTAVMSCGHFILARLEGPVNNGYSVIWGEEKVRLITYVQVNPMPKLIRLSSDSAHVFASEFKSTRPPQSTTTVASTLLPTYKYSYHERRTRQSLSPASKDPSIHLFVARFLAPENVSTHHL